MKRTRWNVDLESLRGGELPFEAFVRRHRGIIDRIAGPWSRRCAVLNDLQDARQEIQLQIWMAVRDWDPARETPLPSFVRLRVRNRMLGMTDRLVRGRAFERRYLELQIVEEKVVPILGGNRSQEDAESPLFVSVTQPLSTDRIEAARRMEIIVGSLPRRKAGLVAGLAAGGALEDVAHRVFGGRTRYSRKRALAAVRAAVELAEEI